MFGFAGRFENQKVTEIKKKADSACSSVCGHEVSL